jgi:nicotinate-nucleotide pyrophosphorylase (carboxylating)
MGNPPVTEAGFGPLEKMNAAALVDAALAEDLGTRGDLTAELTIPADATGAAEFVVRREGVISGWPIVELIARKYGLTLASEPRHPDGHRFQRNQPVGRVEGSMRHILAMERTALNFLQRLSGIATLTSEFVRRVEGTKARIFDTRKTTPGWRILEKYAVRCGGGNNHRLGLYDQVLIKDNHLAWLAGGGDPVGRAIARARAGVPPGTIVEIEVDSIAMLDRALSCNPDIILVDNFSREQLIEAVAMRNARKPSIALEASGGINLESVRSFAETGVDRISIGALTHSAPALDIALDHTARQRSDG